MQKARLLLTIDQIHLIRKKKVIKDRTKEFLHDEIEEIKRYKWTRSEKAKRDLGDACCQEWISKYAAIYRENWEKEHGKVIEEVEIEDGVTCSGCQR